MVWVLMHSELEEFAVKLVTPTERLVYKVLYNESIKDKTQEQQNKK